VSASTYVATGRERARLLLLPGNDLDAGFYEGLLRALARRGVRATALALPGFADEAPLPTKGWEALLRALAPEVARHLAGGGTLVGHSLGAVAAVHLAARDAAASEEGAPPVIRRLVLLEPFAAPWRPLAALLAGTYLREVVRGDRARFRNGGALFRRVHDLRAFPRAAIRRYLAVRRASDPATAEALFQGLPALFPLPLGRVRVPTLLVRGARSGVLPRITQAALAVGLPRSRSVVLPGTGHWVANESDEAAAETLAGFASYLELEV